VTTRAAAPAGFSSVHPVRAATGEVHEAGAELDVEEHAETSRPKATRRSSAAAPTHLTDYDQAPVRSFVLILAGDGPDGLAVLRFRAAIWSTGLECYLAELYVTPARRRHGLGRALMQGAMQEARDLGADAMDIGVDEPDLAARRL
jgi:GNAT superfamily N-acetyltransferase